jgi:death-on-curing protein
MSAFRFLERDLILAIHEIQLAEHGGKIGIRDEGLLDSALGRPEHLAYYDPSADLAAIAAAYAFGIAKKHPFIDGNKRTAFVAMELFIVDNGGQLTADDASALMAMLRLEAGEISESEFAEWIRRNLA